MSVPKQIMMFKGSLNLFSNGTNQLKDTNNLRSRIVNDVSYKSNDLFNDLGFKNNILINFKNLNSVGKNDSEYKTSPQIEMMADFEFASSLPLIKKDEYYNNFLTPKISLRFNPSDMKNYSNSERKININNIFSNNRLGLGDSLETGRSITLGFDYEKEGLNDINKYFALKLATVVRDKEENSIPKVSTLNRKNSNVFGSISTKFSKLIDFNYEFALDNDLQTLEYNSFRTSLNLNNFQTTFNFLEEDGIMGDTNVVKNSTKYTIDDQNYITFNTRRNRKLNLTEYYDLVYEYKNDCLTAGLKYNKTYYQDREIKPTENLMFTLTLYPLTTWEQKINK